MKSLALGLRNLAVGHDLNVKYIRLKFGSLLGYRCSCMQLRYYRVSQTELLLSAQLQAEEPPSAAKVLMSPTIDP